MAIHYGGIKDDPAENWSHVLGLALPTVGEAGKTLAAVLDAFGVVFNNRL